MEKASKRTGATPPLMCHKHIQRLRWVHKGAEAIHGCVNCRESDIQSEDGGRGRRVAFPVLVLTENRPTPSTSAYRVSPTATIGRVKVKQGNGPGKGVFHEFVAGLYTKNGPAGVVQLVELLVELPTARNQYANCAAKALLNAFFSRSFCPRDRWYSSLHCGSQCVGNAGSIRLLSLVFASQVDAQQNITVKLEKNARVPHPQCSMCLSRGHATLLCSGN